MAVGDGAAHELNNDNDVEVEEQRNDNNSETRSPQIDALPKLPSTIEANFDEAKSVSGIFSFDESRHSQSLLNNKNNNSPGKKDSASASGSLGIPTAVMKVYDLGGGGGVGLIEIGNDAKEGKDASDPDIPSYMQVYDLGGGVATTTASGNNNGDRVKGKFEEEGDEENLSYDSSSYQESNMDEDVSVDDESTVEGVIVPNENQIQSELQSGGNDNGNGNGNGKDEKEKERLLKENRTEHTPTPAPLRNSSRNIGFNGSMRSNKGSSAQDPPKSSIANSTVTNHSRESPPFMCICCPRREEDEEGSHPNPVGCTMTCSRMVLTYSILVSVITAVACTIITILVLRYA